MKKEWSRRELYAHGEPFGDCATRRKLGGGYVCGGGGKGSAPAAPDYTAAAQMQGASSKEVTNMQTYANRPTQNTPFGSISWGTSAQIDPATGQPVTTWSQNYNLTPQSQAALDSQMAVQQGRSDLAQSFMGRVENEYAQPFNWGGLPQRGGNVQASNFQTLGSTPQLNTYVGTEASQRVGGTPSLQTQGPSTTQQQMIGSVGDVQRGVQTQGVQNYANFADNPALQGADGAERQRIENMLFERMRPQQEQAQSSLDVKLANQGLAPGSEAYRRAQQTLGDQQSRERFNAFEIGGQEMARMNQMALANRSQMTNEDLAQANLFNSANNQAFNQNLQAGQFGNQALAQQLGMNQTIAGFNNAADQNRYNQQMQNAQFGNTALQNQFQMGLQGTQLNNAAAQQDYAQRLGAAQFGNTAMQNQQGMNQNTAAFNNQVGQNQFAQGMQQSQYQNQLRQAALAEEMQRRGMSLNEMNALLTGQQVGMQQMPNFNAAAASQATQYLPAAQAQYQSSLDAFNAQNQSSNSFTSGLFGLGGSLGSAAMFAFSDSRLKKIIKRVGEIKGVPLYLFKYLGSETEHIGPIAQEVQKIHPSMVKRHQNGYLMVNYTALEA